MNKLMTKNIRRAALLLASIIATFSFTGVAFANYFFSNSSASTPVLDAQAENEAKLTAEIDKLKADAKAAADDKAAADKAAADKAAADKAAADKKPWYKEWWGILAIIVGVLLVSAGVWFAFFRNTEEDEE